ncbi:MAG: tRNA dihydrouridine synthase DusB [Acholeplasmatales bacterium]
MFYIGNIKIENKLILAPMAGISNAAYRLISRELGAGLCVSEMVSDKGLIYENAKTKALLENFKGEHPYSQQIFGSDVETLKEAAIYVDKYTEADIIDINMGCPVPKVALRSQAGAALLKDPNKIYEIVKGVKDVVKKPLTVKIRSGWDFNSINAVEVAKKIEEAGADAITIHARTRSQMYLGKVDLEIIKKVKEAVKIPVIGNGDIVDGPTAKKMLDYTKCDAVMIGRAALGNPFIFSEINAYLNNEEYIEPTKEKIKKVLIKHYELLILLKDEHIATLEMRSLGSHYFKGFHSASEARSKMSKINTKEDFYNVINEYL